MGALRHPGRHYRLLCFSALYALYLAILFGVCQVSDGERWSHTATRVLAPLFELGLASLLCALFVRLYRAGGRRFWLIPPAVIAGIAGLIYFAQAYSLFLSNNFISVLALENSDSAAFVTSPLIMGGVVIGLLWWAMFCAALVRHRNGPAVGAEQWRGSILAIAFAFVCVVEGWLLCLQYRNPRLEPGFRQAPIVNLAATLYAVKFGVQDEQTYHSRTGKEICFRYPVADENAPFPFRKTWVFKTPLPYPRLAGKTGQPNVIVIFSEGMSARLTGAYGGGHGGLTPHIDRLATRSMRVTDYFNHTAATYRGIMGQLSSGFSFAGGGGKTGWETGDNKAALRKIRRRTMPMILREQGYQSYFFSPHKAVRPFTSMLHTLGFDRVFDYESIAHDLLHDRYQTRIHGTDLDDQSLFAGVAAFLRQRRASADDKPFFIGIYNIGTHAFIGVDEQDAKYGDGSNRVLNKFRNFDEALGGFLRDFFDSPWAGNTILIFTSDHATYPETDYRKVAGKDLQPYFVDRIPLLIHDPFHVLPAIFDAQGRNSLDFAPTVLQLLDVSQAENSFLGHSLFAPRSFPHGISALGPQMFLTTKEGVFNAASVPDELQPAFQCESDVVRKFYEVERDNRISAR